MITHNSPEGQSSTFHHSSLEAQRQMLRQLRRDLLFRYQLQIQKELDSLSIMARLITELEQECRKYNIAETIIQSEIVNRTLGDINLRLITECEGEPESTHDYRLLADELGIALPGEQLNAYTASGTTYLWLRHRMMECERLLLKNKYDPRIYDAHGVGNPILRTWLAEEMQQWGLSVTGDQVYLGLDTADCIDKTLHGLAHMYREQNTSDSAILFPEPCCAIPAWQARLCGLRVHRFPTLPEHNFKLTATQLDQLLSHFSDIRILYLAVTNNPTALAYTPDELNALHDVLRNYRRNGRDILIIADLAYVGTGNMQEDHARMGTFVTPDVLKHTLFVSSFSQTHTLTGEHFGWITCGNPAIASAIATGWSNSTASLPGEWQLRFMAYFRLFEMRPWLPEKIRAFYRLRRDRLQAQLQQINEEQHLFAQIYMGDDATIYTWCRLRPQEDAFTFFAKTGIAGVPGSNFGYTNDYIRFSVGSSPVPSSLA